MHCAFETLSHDTREYSDSLVDRVMEEHHEVNDLFKLQYEIEKGLLIFRSILRLDEALRGSAFEGKIEFTEEMDAALHELIKLWTFPCASVLGRVMYFEGRGHHVDNAGEFRDACRQATSILTPDEQFFTGDRLEGLRDAALAEHRRGECAEMLG